MKKNSTAAKKHGKEARSQRQRKGVCQGPMTIGMDLGDKKSCYFVLNGAGEVVKEGTVATTKQGLAQAFAMRRCRVAIEVGTHSPWVSRLLGSLGHEVIVANPRQVKLISQSSRKE